MSSHRPWCRFCEYGDVLGALFILLPQPALHSSARAAPSLSQHPHTELSFGLWQDLSLEQCISSHFQILLSRLKRSPESHHPQGWKKSRITPLIWFLGCLNFLSSGLACCCFFPFVRSYSAKNVPRLISLTLLTLFKSFHSLPSPSLSYLGFWSLFNTCVANLDHQVNVQRASLAQCCSSWLYPRITGCFLPFQPLHVEEGIQVIPSGSVHILSDLSCTCQ